jgi:hypothetical protein
MSVAHEREEKRRAMLVWLLVLAAIPFWTMVGWLSALTMSALRPDRNPVCHEVVRTYQAPPCFDHGPPAVRRYRLPGCGEPLPRFVVPHDGAGALPPGDYWERPRFRRLGLARGEYPHLLLQHRGRGERVVSPHVRW